MLLVTAPSPVLVIGLGAFSVIGLTSIVLIVRYWARSPKKPQDKVHQKKKKGNKIKAAGTRRPSRLTQSRF